DALLEQMKQLMVKHHPQNPAVLTTLGDQELYGQDKAAALGYYQQALENNGREEPVIQNTITLMFDLGENYAEIEQYTVMAVEEFPDKAEFWFFDGTSKLAQKKY